MEVKELTSNDENDGDGDGDDDNDDDGDDNNDPTIKTGTFFVMSTFESISPEIRRPFNRRIRCQAEDNDNI